MENKIFKLFEKLKYCYLFIKINFLTYKNQNFELYIYKKYFFHIILYLKK